MRNLSWHKSIVAACLALLWCCNNANAKVILSSNLPLYGEAKYTDTFQHFEYVNPAAPKGGRVVMPQYGGFDNFNPFIFKGIASADVANLTLESLGVVPADDFSTVYPLLAKKFERPDDNSYIGFILDERAKFHDSSKVTADDVIFSFNSLVEKGAPLYKVYYSDVERVEKVNDHHVRFWFKSGSDNKELPLILTQFKIYSAADFAERDFAKPELRAPLGSGPYRLEKFSAGKYVVFQRVNNYWGQELPSRKGFFNFDEIRYDYYQDTTVTLQALFAGALDIREDFIAKIWVSGYNNEIVKSGKIIQEELPHNQAANYQSFAFNLRLPKFQDRRVRQAIGLAFNFDWANEKLFYNQYERLYSYFTNTGMEATGLPTGKELEILNQYRSQLPESVFEQAPSLPRHHNAIETRENLRQAVRLLQEAGYDFVDGKMTNLQTGEPLTIEVLSNSANGSSFTRIMLPFIANLKKIGITATFRNQEVNIFKNRLDNFDFENAILAFGVSQMPGNEQRELYGSAAADIKGSYNIGGIKNPVIDELVSGLISARHKEDFAAYVKALDRILLHEYYTIPQWYSPARRVAYRNTFDHPKSKIKAGFDPTTWWSKESQQ